MKDVSMIRKGDGNKLAFGFRRPANPSLSGLSKLAQEYLIMLMKTPGLDEFNPSVGGGLASINAFQSKDAVKAEASSNAQKAAIDVKSLQRGKNIPNEERLKGINIINIDVLDNGVLIMEINVISANNKKAFVRFRS